MRGNVLTRQFENFMTDVRVLFLVVFVGILNFSCGSKNIVNSKIDLDGRMPRIILWAWERPEDLRFLDVKNYGVAFLSETLLLQNDKVIFQPRRQPLKISPSTFLIAVTRIETDKAVRPTLSDAQENEIISDIKRTLSLPNIKAVQIDFDALVSERDFYRSLLRDLKKELPAEMPLTITALASWCASDNWFGDVPIDEAVPMAFQMGADDKTIRSFLADGNDWQEHLCRKSYGIGLNEPLQINFKPERRFYLFNSRAWQAEDLSHLPEGVRP